MKRKKFMAVEHRRISQKQKYHQQTRKQLIL